jgi:hypothetical protein
MRTASTATLIALALALALASCSPSTIALRDPHTGETAQCHGDAQSRWNPEATEDCARGYEASGWVRVPQD